MKKLVSVLCVLMCLCLPCRAEEFIPDLSDARPLQAAISLLNISREPVIIAGSGVPEKLCDEVEILLAEVGSVGEWLCGGALVRPADPAATLLMPGSAFWDEDCPYYDGRHYAQVAADDGKTLYAVYVYPVALDSSPMYALDSLALHGGAMVTFGYGEKDLAMPDTLDLTVQIYRVAPDGKFTAVVNTLISLETPAAVAEESAAAPV